MLKKMFSMAVVACALGLTVGAAGSANAESKIVYSASIGTNGNSPTGDYQIFTMNPDGTEQTQLTNGCCHATEPVWIENGSKILFVRMVPENQCAPSGESRMFFTMNADGSDQQMLGDCTTGEGYQRDIGGVSWTFNVPQSVAAISPFGQFAIVFILGGATALWMTSRNPMVVRV